MLGSRRGGVNYPLLVAVAVVAGVVAVGVWWFGFSGGVREVHEMYPALNRVAATPSADGSTTPPERAPAANRQPVASDSPPTAAAASWVLKTDVDRLTDRETLTASSTVPLSEESPYLYKLTLKCDGTSRQVTVATFERLDLSDGATLPRAIEFDTDVRETGSAQYVEGVRVPNVAAVSFAWFKSRVDEQEPETYQLVPVLDNVGKVVHPLSRALGDFFGNSLPENRLVIANVFPDEQVEFRFDQMTEPERMALQGSCFPRMPPAANR